MMVWSNRGVAVNLSLWEAMFFFAFFVCFDSSPTVIVYRFSIRGYLNISMLVFYVFTVIHIPLFFFYTMNKITVVRRFFPLYRYVYRYVYRALVEL